MTTFLDQVLEICTNPMSGAQLQVVGDAIDRTSAAIPLRFQAAAYLEESNSVVKLKGHMPNNNMTDVSN